MTKIERVYMTLMEGKSLNRFEAARLLHDHCLHTTVSTIQQKYCVTIKRIFEAVRGYMGNPTTVCRYWIDIKERERIKSERQEIRKRKEVANRTLQDVESDSSSYTANVNPSQIESQFSAEYNG